MMVRAFFLLFQLPIGLDDSLLFLFCTGSHYIAGTRSDSPVSAYPALGLQVCPTMPGLGGRLSIWVRLTFYAVPIIKPQPLHLPKQVLSPLSYPTGPLDDILARLLYFIPPPTYNLHFTVVRWSDFHRTNSYKKRNKKLLFPCLVMHWT